MDCETGRGAHGGATAAGLHDSAHLNLCGPRFLSSLHIDVGR